MNMNAKIMAYMYHGPVDQASHDMKAPPDADVPRPCIYNKHQTLRKDFSLFVSTTIECAVVTLTALRIEHVVSTHIT